MPTYGDETLHERYQREHADHLARLAKMTPEQIAEMAMSLHNALAEADRLRTQLKAMSCDSGASAYIPVDRQTGEQWPPVKDKGSGAICDYIPLFKAHAGALQGVGEVATHIGWDFLDDRTQVATYFIRVAGKIAPKLYTHLVAAPVSRTSVELLNLAEHLLNSEVFNNDGSVRSVTQEERDELRARIEKHLTEMPVQP